MSVVARTQLLHDGDGYATNKAAVSDELLEQRRRCEEIDKFGCDHSLHVSFHLLYTLTQ